ncbi:MAG: L-ascorbate metabolism protein UlaG (beta-lactamase superfamily) [Pseudorhodobacter sp.]
MVGFRREDEDAKLVFHPFHAILFPINSFFGGMRMSIRVFLFAFMLASPVVAQDRIPSHCIALADASTEIIHRAGFFDPLPEGEVRIRYLDHASFAIGTPGGKFAVTDYTGFVGLTDKVPDVVTMNNAHISHWTGSPDTQIPHILEGWATADKPAEHRLELDEMLIRNVPTDVRRGFDVRANGNSIFIFEVAGLCIGHLGHLHHIPDAEQFAAIGRLDVLMVPVDGGFTLDLPSMLQVVRRLRSSVVLPMHWFSGVSLERFLAEMRDEFDVVRLEDSQIDLSLSRLPGRPTIMVLDPQSLP